MTPERPLVLFAEPGDAIPPRLTSTRTHEYHHFWRMALIGDTWPVVTVLDLVVYDLFAVFEEAVFAPHPYFGPASPGLEIVEVIHMRPTPSAPHWADAGQDTLMAWFPDAPLTCQACQRPNGATLVYGRFTRPAGSLLPRVCTGAFCVDHLPVAWYSEISDASVPPAVQVETLDATAGTRQAVS